MMLFYIFTISLVCSYLFKNFFESFIVSTTISMLTMILFNKPIAINNAVVFSQFLSIVVISHSILWLLVRPLLLKMTPKKLSA